MFDTARLRSISRPTRNPYLARRDDGPRPCNVCARRFRSAPNAQSVLQTSPFSHLSGSFAPAASPASSHSFGRPPQFKSTNPPQSSVQIHPVRRAKHTRAFEIASPFSFRPVTNLCPRPAPNWLVSIFCTYFFLFCGLQDLPRGGLTVERTFRSDRDVVLRRGVER